MHASTKGVATLLSLAVFLVASPLWAAPDSLVTVYDNFDDGNFDGWSVQHPYSPSGSSLTPAVVSSPEGYSIRGVGSGYGSPEAAYLVRPISVSNVGKLTIEMRAKSGPASPSMASVWLLNDAQWYRGMDYGESNHAATLQVNLGGGETYLGWHSTDYNWHTFTWDRDAQGYCSLSIDGQLEQQNFWQDATLDSFNMIALEVTRNQSEIEWVRVSADTSSSQTGQLGAWQDLGALPSTASGRYTAVANGHIYTIDGQGTTWYAELGTDGTPGPWTATSAFSTARSNMGLIAAGNALYMVGGGHAGPTTTVKYAAINTDGSLGPWVGTSSLNGQRSDTHLAVWNGYLYAVGGWSSNWTFLNTVEYARINSDGSLGSWQMASSTQQQRPDSAVVAVDGYLYTFAGGRHSYLTNTVERAAINPDGSLGAWQYDQALPANRASHAAAVIGDTVYVIGGYQGSYGSQYQTTVFYATIQSDHSPGQWQETSELLHTGRMAAAVSGQRIYASGYSTDLGMGRLQMAIVASPPLPLEVEIRAEDSLSWVYQNTPLIMMDGGHKLRLESRIVHSGGNTTFDMAIAEVPDSGPGEVTIEDDPGGDLLVKYVCGSMRGDGISGTGPLTLEVTVTGNTGDVVTVNVPFTVRPLGDVDGNGGPEPGDVMALILALNGAPPAGYHARAFDLDANGAAEPGDVSMLINILNGQPVP